MYIILSLLGIHLLVILDLDFLSFLFDKGRGVMKEKGLWNSGSLMCLVFLFTLCVGKGQMFNIWQIN